MAYAQSTQKAQTPKPCAFCKTDTNIRWRCVLCKTYMCDGCKNTHVIHVVHSSIQHEIIDIKECGDVLDIEPTLITDNIPCQIHKRKVNCMFCCSCDVLVCSDCISSSHKKHDLETIDKVCEEKIEKLTQFKQQILKNCSICKLETNTLQRTEIKRDSMYAEAIKQIDNKEKEIIEETTKDAQELRDKIEKDQKETKILISKGRLEIKQVEHSLEIKLEKVKIALQSNQGSTIFNAVIDTDENLQNLSFTELLQEIQDFVPVEKTNHNNILRLFGSLTSIKMKKENCLALNLTKSYTTDLSCVTRLVSIDNKTAWISNHTRKVLKQVVIDDNIQTIKQIPVWIYDMALTQSNDILMSMFCSSEVKLLTISGEIQPFLSVAPLLPCGIHVTNNNNIILGVVETGGTFKQTDRSCRKVIVFDENKKEIQSYQYNKHKQRLFTFPDRVTGVNSDIVVIKATSEDEGRVVVLGKEGDVKWTYEGQPQINTENKPFNPRDIVTTSLGNVIVADGINHTLHVISGEGGQLLTYKVMSDQGVIFPLSLDIDTCGQLWVGCNTYNGKPDDAKVHMITFYC